MTETTTERPPVPDLAQVFGAPAATVLARADEVLLGDVVDSADGPVRVREIVQRLQRWELAGDPPGQPVRYSSSRSTDGLPPLTRVTLPPYARIRVRRTIRSFGRLTGHAKKVASHNPVKRGWYTHVDGYTAACSCGWASPTVHDGQGSAGAGWLAHKAGQITEAAYADNSALMFIATAEVVYPQLPPVPWRFTSITSGDHKGVGVGQADLSRLPLDQAGAVLVAWQAVPGLTIGAGSCLDENLDVPVHTATGRRRMTADLRLFLNGPRSERLNLTAAYYAPDNPADSSLW